MNDDRHQDTVPPRTGPPNANVDGIGRLLFPAALAATFLFAACSGGGLFGTRGEGNVKTENRPTTAFTHVDAGDGIAVTIRIGPAEDLVISAQENLLGLIATDVQGDTLRIHGSGAYTTSEPIAVTVVTPALDGITLSGGSHGRIDGLGTERLDVELNGGTVVEAAGVATTLALKASGGSRAELGDLAAKSVRVDLSGGSQVTLQASDQVNGSAAGGSQATVIGEAALNVSLSGGSAVEHR
jgi:hypothetical protein